MTLTLLGCLVGSLDRALRIEVEVRAQRPVYNPAMVVWLRLEAAEPFWPTSTPR